MNENEEKTDKQDVGENEKTPKTRNDTYDIMWPIAWSIPLSMLSLGALYVILGWFDPDLQSLPFLFEVLVKAL